MFGLIMALTIGVALLAWILFERRSHIRHHR